eukprot:2535933-Prymnesium_polylepis.1
MELLSGTAKADNPRPHIMLHAALYLRTERSLSVRSDFCLLCSDRFAAGSAAAFRPLCCWLISGSTGAQHACSPHGAPE